MAEHSWECVCGGRGTVEDGPAGATYSAPCPGPPGEIDRFGRTYLITPKGETVAVVPVATLGQISAENERLREALHRVAWTAPHDSEAHRIAFDAMEAEMLAGTSRTKGAPDA